MAELTHRSRRVPLPRPWGPDVTHVHVVATRVTSSAGVGHGFSWTPRAGAGAIAGMLDEFGAALAEPLDPAPVWDRLWADAHEAGGGGVTTMALAGVDIALWDLRGRAEGRSLVDLLGRRHTAVPVYGSGVNLHYPVEDLVAQARRMVAAGYAGVKIKVGLPDLASDIARVAAVRSAIGEDVALMVDANQRWDLPTALRAVSALAEFRPYWLEEPLRADDLRAHAELRRRCPFPIALGENLHTAYQFREAILLGACDIIQPNVVRVGGITPFLRIAELARALGVGVAPHLLPDLSGQLALTLPGPVWVEEVEDASFAALDVLSAPSGVEVKEGRLTADTGPGHGLRFHWLDSDTRTPVPSAASSPPLLADHP
ncbi:mandelate racemase/muconate lactonizing enzyme family protein [Actinokineospora sp. UTMC 2448]|uniref:mandelate racemase/muconate lactonizing enzyme family protein n=1 Tax=Actinokineospora sp. UTMC 2448 TaxID=2268449 RepID=UPI002164278A|nr:mandelate racemase/muconate lactonizing enzyme family protein [Actinokineospora sp. UTMC 2448]UVS78924.1 Mandelate racemase [Actinokineospora sp. UTMC 2448]